LKDWGTPPKIAEDADGPHKSRSDPYRLTARGREEAAKLALPLDPASADLQDPISEDLRKLLADRAISETERQQLIQARLGQDKFRDQALAASSGRCAATGCSISQAIRASHIKPWRDSNNVERRDPANGMALTAKLDALFDAHMITFEDDERIRLSSRMTRLQVASLGPMNNLQEPPSEVTRGYLRVHRNEFCRKEQERARPGV
jgi:hypothetical protein